MYQQAAAHDGEALWALASTVPALVEVIISWTLFINLRQVRVGSTTGYHPHAAMLEMMHVP